MTYTPAVTRYLNAALKEIDELNARITLLQKDNGRLTESLTDMTEKCLYFEKAATERQLALGLFKQGLTPEEVEKRILSNDIIILTDPAHKEK